MSKGSIKVNKYVYFDKFTGKFFLSAEAAEIVYRRKNIICSYSGCDDWINFFTLEMMNIYTGSSPYNFALGTCDHHEMVPEFFKLSPYKLCEWVEESTKKEWGIRMYKMIEHIIDDLPECEK